MYTPSCLASMALVAKCFDFCRSFMPEIVVRIVLTWQNFISLALRLLIGSSTIFHNKCKILPICGIEPVTLGIVVQRRNHSAIWRGFGQLQLQGDSRCSHAAYLHSRLLGAGDADGEVLGVLPDFFVRACSLNWLCPSKHQFVACSVLVRQFHNFEYPGKRIAGGLYLSLIRFGQRGSEIRPILDNMVRTAQIFEFANWPLTSRFCNRCFSSPSQWMFWKML